MSNKQVGKFHEKRGDDYFVVNVTEDGDVVEIVQRDSIRLTYPSINFFAESAPKLITLLQKAAGIKAEKVEYEYAIQRVLITPDYPTNIVGDHWSKRGEVNLSLLELNSPTVEYTLVKRRKVGEVEAA